MAKNLAREIGYIYIDTGAMYRAVTLYALKRRQLTVNRTVKSIELEREMPLITVSFAVNHETGHPDTFLNGENVEQEIQPNSCLAFCTFGVGGPTATNGG